MQECIGFVLGQVDSDTLREYIIGSGGKNNSGFDLRYAMKDLDNMGLFKGLRWREHMVKFLVDYKILVNPHLFLVFAMEPYALALAAGKSHGRNFLTLTNKDFLTTLSLAACFRGLYARIAMPPILAILFSVLSKGITTSAQADLNSLRMDNIATLMGAASSTGHAHPMFKFVQFMQQATANL